MRMFVRLAVGAAAMVSLCSIAQAKVHIRVDLDDQTIHVDAGDKVYDWKVSSGKSGYDTPPGKYGVLWMDKDHKSDEYDGAPMPNAIFFAPGYAIHGAYKSDFGHPASHGCVRLPVEKSALLFDLVKAQGADITITGGDPTATVARSRRANPDEDAYGYAETPRYYEPRDASASYGASGYGYYQEPAQPQPAPGYGSSYYGGLY